MLHNNNMKRSENDSNRNQQGREGRKRDDRKNSRNNVNKNNDNNKKKERKVSSDCIFYLKTSKQADDCEIISKCLIDHIEKTCFNEDDIENALNQLQKIDFKKSMLMKEKVEVDKDEKDENKMTVSDASAEICDSVFTAEITNFVKRKAACQLNKEKACAFIFSQCIKSMQFEIEALSNFEFIEGNSILSLSQTKNLSMNC